MSKTVDLKALERKAYLSYHGDGILDLYLGFCVIWISILIVILPEFFVFLIGSFVALVPAYTSTKNSFTVPRLGYVEFSPKRVGKTKRLMFAINILGFIGVALGMLAWLNPAARSLLITYHLILLGSGGAAVFLLAALLTGVQRFYGYGVIVFGGFVIAHIFVLSILVPILALGLIMIILGGILLFRFTRKYPKTEEDEADW